MTSKTIAKFVFGVLLFVAGFYWYSGSVPYFANTLSNLKTVFGGVFGVVLIVAGALIAWLEYDEWKTQRALAAEERKARRKGRK